MWWLLLLIPIGAAVWWFGRELRRSFDFDIDTKRSIDKEQK